MSNEGMPNQMDNAALLQACRIREPAQVLSLLLPIDLNDQHEDDSLVARLRIVETRLEYLDGFTGLRIRLDEVNATIPDFLADDEEVFDVFHQKLVDIIEVNREWFDDTGSIHFDSDFSKTRTARELQNEATGKTVLLLLLDTYSAEAQKAMRLASAETSSAVTEGLWTAASAVEHLRVVTSTKASQEANLRGQVAAQVAQELTVVRHELDMAIEGLSTSDNQEDT